MNRREINILINKKIISRLPSFYILFKVYKTGPINALFNIRGYKAIKKNNLLDLRYYSKNNPNVINLSMDPILHYIYYGFNEGKKPYSTFNGKKYLKTHKDVKNSKLNPLVHYSLYGIKEGRKTEKYPKVNKKRILYVLHSSGGGTPATNEDLMRNIEKELDCYVLTSSAVVITLSRYENSNFKEIKSWKIKSEWSAMDFNNPEFSDIYFKILKDLKIDIIHIRHLIKHSFDLPKVAKELKLPIIISFHDFYFICPSHNLLDDETVYCAGKCTDGQGQCLVGGEFKNFPLLRDFVNEWRNEVAEILCSASALVTTSELIKQLFISIYPGLSQKEFRIIEHGRDFKKIEDNSKFYEIPSKHKPIKILFPGNLNASKGSELIKKIKMNDKDSRLEFHFLGGLYLHSKDLEEYGIYHGPYERNNFCKEVEKIKPSFIGILSIWPETYCHTLSEAWSCGVPVLTSKIGVLEERVNKTGGGWLLDYENPEEAYNEIIKIADSEEEYIEVAEKVKEISFKSTKEMAMEYYDLYCWYLDC